MCEKSSVYIKLQPFPSNGTMGTMGQTSRPLSPDETIVGMLRRKPEHSPKPLLRLSFPYSKLQTLRHFESHIGNQAPGSSGFWPQPGAVGSVHFLSRVASPSPRRDMETSLYRESNFLLLFCPQRPYCALQEKRQGAFRVEIPGAISLSTEP